MDRDLHLPQAWTLDRDRCRAAKIPDERGFAAKGELIRNIVRRSPSDPEQITYYPAYAPD